MFKKNPTAYTGNGFAADKPAPERTFESAALRRLSEPLEFPSLEWPETAPQPLPPDPTAPVRMPALSPVGVKELPPADRRVHGRSQDHWPNPPPIRAGLRPEPAVLAMRRPPAPFDRELTRLGVRWMLSIPRRHRPRELAARFPHVVNRMALLWGKRDLVSRYFDDLMVDRRGNRQGFPREVTQEILALHGHFEALFDRNMRPFGFNLDSDSTQGEPTVPMPLEWSVG